MFWHGVWASTSLVILVLQYVSGSAHFLQHEFRNTKAWPWTKDEHGHDADARKVYDPRYRQSKLDRATQRVDHATQRVEDFETHSAQGARAQRRRNASQVPELPQPISEAKTKLSPKTVKPALAGRKPRVHFLFLAVDKISNMKVWKAFFQGAPPSLFRAYVHCKTYACETFVARSFSALRTVPTANSQYCTDLVSPMISLLSHAMDHDDDGTHPYDKFVFVSDSTLPAKSFYQVYNTLSERDGSDFCVFPAGEWADRSTRTGMELIPKHHQWITLASAHAQKLVQLWQDHSMRNLMSTFHMNWHSYQWNNNSYGDQRNFGCLDEFWFMGALYGTIQVGEHATKSVWLDGFANGPLRVDSDAAWQGTCDTFVNWEKHLHAGYRNPFEVFHDQLDQLSTPHGGNSARPGWWDRMTPTGLQAIKESDFLFVRKFIDAPELVSGHGQTFADAFVDIVLK